MDRPHEFANPGSVKAWIQICWRPLRKGELDHELIWLSVSLVSALCLLLALRLHWPLPACPFHDLTGFPCLTCGATRCFIQLSQGHLLTALRWNPGAFAALNSLLLFNLYAGTVVILRLPRLRVVRCSPGFARWIRRTAWTLAALNWVYLIKVL